MGRPNGYKKKVEPYLAEVSEMALTMTEQQIAKTLGVGYSTFRLYKEQYPALADSLKKGRAKLVMELKSALIKKAKGFEYEETKITKEYGSVVKEEITKKRTTPDVAAINLLLKNYDETWHNDPKEYALKKQALELQEKKVEENSW